MAWLPLVSFVSLSRCFIFAAASSSEHDRAGSNYSASSCESAGACPSKEHLLIQMNRGFALSRSQAHASTTAAGCCAACGGKGFCSPQSGNCYDVKHKHYYESCKPQSITCCASCGGKHFCSPQSGQCYDSKSKGYYTECAAMDTQVANQDQEAKGSCCAGCLKGEAGFCSPTSGNCYPSKGKPYYQSCPIGGEVEPKKHELIVDWVKFFPMVNDSLAARPTFEDNFDHCPADMPDPSKWKYEIFGPNSKNSEAQTYTSEKENAFCENGQLILRALCKDGNKCRDVTCSPDGPCHSPHGALTSGSIETGFEFGFGRLAARIKIGGEQEGRIGKGMWPAFWSLGEDIGTHGWPSCGEIDIMEYSEPHRTNGQNAYFRNNPYTWKRQHWVTTETKVHNYVMDSDGYRVFTLEYAQDAEGHTRLKMWVTETYEETLDTATAVNIEYPKPGMPRNMVEDFDYSFNGKKINAKLNVAVGGNLGGRGPYFD